MAKFDYPEFLNLMSRKIKSTADRLENLMNAFKIFDREGVGLISSAGNYLSILYFYNNLCHI